MASSVPQDVQALVETILGMECWYVCAGGSVGASFGLALGERRRRSVPLKNRAHTAEYREFEGEAQLLVWCTWRLDDADCPRTSSDQDSNLVAEGLQSIVGRKVVDCQVRAPGWDLSLSFSSGLSLHVFCDHLPGQPSFDGNWQLAVGDSELFVGPGTEISTSPRR